MGRYIDGLIYAGVLAIIICFGSGRVDASNYKGIYYDDFKYTDNVTFNKVDGLNIDYAATLEGPGDYYELEFKVVNETANNMKVTDCIYNKNDQYINYELTYEDGTPIKSGDIIKKGEKKNLKYRVSYVKMIDTLEYEFDSSFNIEYEQVI